MRYKTTTAWSDENWNPPDPDPEAESYTDMGGNEHEECWELVSVAVVPSLKLLRFYFFWKAD